MENTLTQILDLLYRTLQENQLLNRRIQELEKNGASKPTSAQNDTQSRPAV